MSDRLVSEHEQDVTLTARDLDTVSRALIRPLLDPSDPVALEEARAELRRVPMVARWVLELVVEVELAANGVPLNYPSGLRS